MQHLPPATQFSLPAGFIFTDQQVFLHADPHFPPLLVFRLLGCRGRFVGNLLGVTDGGVGGQ